MGIVRAPAVAGAFYPADSGELAQQIAGFLEAAAPVSGVTPKAIIVPHAGTIYSGPIAASAYARLGAARDTIHRVVLLGPSHRLAFQGIATSSAERFMTPLGDIPVDREALHEIVSWPDVVTRDSAHSQEHSLEVQLPFLQTVLGRFSLVPLVIGSVEPERVAMVLNALWGGPETLIVISSDLSHYLSYAAAKQRDEAARQAIEHLDPLALDDDQACGLTGIDALLLVAKQRGLSVETLDLRNSGDTAGPRDRVVG